MNIFDDDDSIDDEDIYASIEHDEIDISTELESKALEATQRIIDVINKNYPRVVSDGRCIAAMKEASYAAYIIGYTEAVKELTET